MGLGLSVYAAAVGTIGAGLALHRKLKTPNLEFSDVSAGGEDVDFRSCTVFNEQVGPRRARAIPTIYGQVVVSNSEGILSEAFRDVECHLSIVDDGAIVRTGNGAWEESGKKSLDKETTIKTGTARRVQVLRAIIEPKAFTADITPYEFKPAAEFNLLNIDSSDPPLFETSSGRIWVHLPAMIEATHGGWSGTDPLPPTAQASELHVELRGENGTFAETYQVNFRKWLKENSSYWQSGWLDSTPTLIQQAQDIIDEL